MYLGTYPFNFVVVLSIDSVEHVLMIHASSDMLQCLASPINDSPHPILVQDSPAGLQDTKTALD